MGIREPCQVGNEAALSGTSHVTWGNRGLKEGLILYFPLAEPVFVWYCYVNNICKVDITRCYFII